MINIPLRPSGHQTKLKNKAIVHSNLSMQAVITDINTVYPWHSRKNLLAVNYYYPKYHIMYQVLHFNALQVSIQNTRFQRTYTPIIRTTSYIISTLINTDLIYSCGMLKKKVQISKQLSEEEELHLSKGTELHFLNIERPPLITDKV